jgi:tetratricopeptide (TPR) repeat protein
MSMNKILTISILVMSVAIKTFAQECTDEAKLAYKNADNLITSAQSACGKGDHAKEKEYAEKYFNETRKIEAKYNCFSPVADWALWKSCLHLGDFNAALKHANNMYQHCETFARTGCDCLGKSIIRKGIVYSAMGNDSMAIIEYKKALAICKGYKLVTAFTDQQIGDSEKKKNNVNSAIDRYTEAENIIEAFAIENNGEVDEFSELILGRCHCSRGEIYLKQGNCSEALPAFLTALHSAQMTFDAKTIATCNYNIARIYDLNSKFTDAIKYYTEAIIISKQMGYNEILLDSYNRMSIINECHGNHSEAMKFASDALEKAKDIQYKQGMADAYNMKGFINRNQGNGDDLFSNTKSAAAIAEDIKYKEGMADAYYNMEVYYENKNDNKSAREYARLALQVAASVDYSIIEADSYNGLGHTYKKEGKLDSALHYYNLALSKAKEGSYMLCGQYKEGMVDAYNNIGDIYKRQNKKDKAADNFYHALVIAEEILYQEGIDNSKKGCVPRPIATPPALQGRRKR